MEGREEGHFPSGETGRRGGAPLPSRVTCPGRAGRASLDGSCFPASWGCGRCRSAGASQLALPLGSGALRTAALAGQGEPPGPSPSQCRDRA